MVVVVVSGDDAVVFFAESADHLVVEANVANAEGMFRLLCEFSIVPIVSVYIADHTENRLPVVVDFV